MAITLFSSPRPFTDPHIAMIQSNAIASWLQLRPRPQVLLIGDDAGVAEVAHEMGVTHIPDVATTPHGIPRRDSMHQLAHRFAQYELLCLINADIIILSGFYESIHVIPFAQYVATGRRFDVDVTSPIRFDSDTWRTELHELLNRSGALHGPSAVDFAIYPKMIDPPILPPFPMNLPGWDTWYLFEYKKRRIPVVNLNTAVTVIHQNHDSTASKRQKQHIWRRDHEAREVLKRAGGFSSRATLREADYIITDGELRRPSGVNRLLSRMVHFKPYRVLLAGKRRLQQFV